MRRLVVLVTLISAAYCSKVFSKAYCWRDFDGVIPRDAFIAGYDKRNSPLYVGQIYFNNKIIPGELHDNDDTLYFEFGEQERSANRNIKILCTEFQEKFSWFQTTSYAYRGLQNITLVKGGHEPGFFTYVGRRRDDQGETHVGKVICRDVTCLGLYTSKKGEPWKQHYRYEVLTYRPEVKGKEEEEPLTVKQ